MSPDYVPVKDVIVATELACKNIANDKAAELRARVANIVKTSKPPTSNVTQNERTAIENLSKDKNIKILPADKGRAIDNSKYEEKAQALLQDEKVYENLK